MPTVVAVVHRWDSPDDLETTVYALGDFLAMKTENTEEWMRVLLDLHRSNCILFEYECRVPLQCIPRGV